MRTFITLLILCVSSVTSFAQSIAYFYPSEARRNAQLWFNLEGVNTHFMQSSSLSLTLESNVDGSVITTMDVNAGSETYCYGSFKIPATATPGSYKVSILTTNEGTLNFANGFTVTNEPPVPELISISPNTAHNGESVQATIYARYAQFLSSSDFYVYLYGSSANILADSIEVVNDTTLSVFFDIPVTTLSTVCDVVVTNNTDYLGLTGAFTIDGLEPDIMSVSPNTASNGTHVDVTIRTKETSFTQVSSLSIQLQSPSAGINATSFSVINDSVLIASFDIPQRARTATYDLIVYMDWNTIYELGVFSINGINPVLVDVSPAQAEQGQTLDVTISGTDMHFASASNIDLTFYHPNGSDYFTGASTVVLNDDQIKTTINIPTNIPVGQYGMYASIDGDYSYLEDAFTVLDDGIPDPELISISPSTAFRGQTLDVIITGSSTTFTQATNIQVALSGNNYFLATSVTPLSNTQLRCTFDIPAHAQPGLYSVYFMSAFNTTPLILEQAFNITRNITFEPALISISSAYTFPGETLDVTITGVNTHFQATSSSLELFIFSQSTYVVASSFTATSNTTIVAQFEIPEDLPLGIYDFGVYSVIDGFLDLLQSVMVNAVGLDEEESLISKLYPNPVHDNLYIETKQQVKAMTIVDITGKQMILDLAEIKQDPTHLVIPIDKLGLRSGIYFIRLESEDGFDYQKFIVE